MTFPPPAVTSDTRPPPIVAVARVLAWLFAAYLAYWAVRIVWVWIDVLKVVTVPPPPQAVAVGVLFGVLVPALSAALLGVGAAMVKPGRPLGRHLVVSGAVVLLLGRTVGVAVSPMASDMDLTWYVVDTAAAIAVLAVALVPAVGRYVAPVGAFSPSPYGPPPSPPYGPPPSQPYGPPPSPPYGPPTGDSSYGRPDLGAPAPPRHDPSRRP